MQEPERPATGSSVVHLTIDEAGAGQRIDNLLIKRLPGVPRTRIYRIIRKGEVRVNGSRAKPSLKLAAGDTVRIPPLKNTEKPRAAVPDDFVEKLESAIVFEDERIIALDKPAGAAVHAGSGLQFGIIEAIRQSRDNQRLELIHRLDRQTSGCLLIGKTLKATREFQDRFRERSVNKSYLSLIVGKWQVADFEVRNRLISNVEISGERMVVADVSGKEAISRFTTLARFPDATEIQVKIETGRTHQIRVHSADCGYPVIGDKKYGNAAKNSDLRKRGLKRMFLHAARISFSGDCDISCPPGPDWEQARQELQKENRQE